MSDEVSLKVLAERMEGRHALYHAWREEANKALTLLAVEHERRLNVLNHAHEEARRIQNTYVTGAVYEKDHEAFLELRDAFNKWKATKDGGFSSVAVLGAILVSLIPLASLALMIWIAMK